MTEEYISLKELATELGMDRSHTRRYVLRLGIEPKKRWTPDSGGQLTLTVNADEARFIRQTREEQGFLSSGKPVQNETGQFYIIQLVPELDPNRVKLGFADDINARLAQHRTAAPTAILLKSWPGKRSWEGTVIDALASVGGKLILSEVFEFRDLDSVLKRADELFELLPAPASKIPLSERSPHYTSGGKT